MANKFGVLPLQAARALDDDPLQLTLGCLELLEYASAKAVYDTKNKKAMTAYHGQRMLRRVEDIAHEMAEAATEAEDVADSARASEIAAQGESSNALATQREDG